MNAQHELDLDRLNREIDKITAERDAAQAKCAEMRAILKSAIDDLPMYGHVGPLKEFLARTDCGKGWHSPAEWEVLENDWEQLKKWGTELGRENVELQAKCAEMRAVIVDAVQRRNDMDPTVNILMNWLHEHPENP